MNKSPKLSTSNSIENLNKFELYCFNKIILEQNSVDHAREFFKCFWEEGTLTFRENAKNLLIEKMRNNYMFQFMSENNESLFVEDIFESGEKVFDCLTYGIPVVEHETVKVKTTLLDKLRDWLRN